MIFDYVVMVGDGINDLETKGIVELMISYGEFITRWVVKNNANHFIVKLDQLFNIIEYLVWLKITQWRKIIHYFNKYATFAGGKVNFIYLRIGIAESWKLSDIGKSSSFGTWSGAPLRRLNFCVIHRDLLARFKTILSWE